MEKTKKHEGERVATQDSMLNAKLICVGCNIWSDMCSWKVHQHISRYIWEGKMCTMCETAPSFRIAL